MRTTALLVLIALHSLTVSAGTTVTVSAGKVERVESVVSFVWPATLDPKGNYGLVIGGRTIPVQVLPFNGSTLVRGLREEGGQTKPFQLMREHRAVFVLGAMKAGETREYALEAIPQVSRPPLPTDVSIKEEGTNVTVSVGAKTVFRYNGDKTPLPEGFDASLQRGGYLFPILTPSGKLVTDDYPPMHKHHHGIWFAWTSTQFEGRKPDFWNMGQKRGTVEFVKLESSFSGAVAGGIRAAHRYVDLSAKDGAKVALTETWEVTGYGVGAGDKPYFMFDVEVTQKCAGESPLVLPKYHYGGIGFRGHRDWNEKKPDAYTALTSEGKDRKSANETMARWCHMGGIVEGKPVGLAILDHPTNFRSPQPVRVHPGEPYFCYSPQQAGEFSIEPGKGYSAKYRVVVTDGEADKGLLDRVWADWAEPVGVVIK